MKLGLLSDIHENVHLLRVAIDRLRELGAERFVVLGDVFDRGPKLDATAALLDEVRAVGVWGNHDSGFCLGTPRDGLLERYSERTLRVMAGLRPRLVLGDCHFSHIEARLNPESFEDLWAFEEPPETAEAIAPNFAAVPQRLLFMGHIHCWRIASTREVLPWDGETPFTFDPAERYFVIVHAVADGWAALLDTEGATLTPVRLTLGA